MTYKVNVNCTSVFFHVILGIKKNELEFVNCKA